jgi:hypothetical protein
MVTRGNYGKGTKSERMAIFIETHKGRYLLRRKGASAFADATLDKFVGEKVVCEGFLLGSSFLATGIKIQR